jgi:hypothetical protein
VPAGIISAASVLAVNFVIQTDGTWTLAQSQTAIALLLGMTGLWVLTTLSIPLTPPRIGILAAMAVLASGIFLIRPFAEFFGFATLSGDQLMFVVLAGLAANAVIAVVARVVDLRIGTAAIQPPRP